MSNDRFKYRAWDGVSMRYDVTGFEQGVENEMGGVFLDGDYFTMDEDCKHHHTFAEVMQFTGLTDSNGVEIYESDVVNDHVGIGVVEYSTKYAGFRVNYKSGRCKWFYDYLDSEQKSIQVIGNIYNDSFNLGEHDQ